MDRFTSLSSLAVACVAALVIAALSVAPAAASAPVVLAQFFEHFEGWEGEEERPADRPAVDDPALRDLDVPDLGSEFEGAAPGAGAGLPPLPQDGTLEGGLELGLVPPDFDPADRPKLLADLYDRLGQAGSAADAEPIASAIEQLWNTSGSDTVDLLMARAAVFANAAEIDLSLAILDAIVDIAPNETEAWYLRAKVNVLAGKPENALTDLRRALGLDAKHYRAIADLGLLLEQLGAKKEALEAYRRALAVNPFLEDAQAGVEALKREVEGQDI